MPRRINLISLKRYFDGGGGGGVGITFLLGLVTDFLEEPALQVVFHRCIAQYTVKHHHHHIIIIV